MEMAKRKSYRLIIPIVETIATATLKIIKGLMVLRMDLKALPLRKSMTRTAT